MDEDRANSDTGQSREEPKPPVTSGGAVRDNRDWFKTLLKKPQSYFLPVTGFVYLSGFIVVSSYLYQFGVSDISLVRSRYLSAGILFVSIFAAYLALSFSTCILLHHAPLESGKPPSESTFRDELKRGGRFLLWLIKSLILLGICAAVLALFFTVVSIAPSEYPDLRPSSPQWLPRFLRPIVGGWSRIDPYILERFSTWLVVAFVGGAFIVPPPSIAKEIQTWPSQAKRILAASSIGPVMCALYLYTVVDFGAFMYRFVLPSFGGGAAVQVEIQLDEQRAKEMRKDFSTPLSGKVRLLDQTESGYIVLIEESSKQKALWIRRDMVMAVKYLEHRAVKQ